MYEYSAVVTKICDGATVVVDINLGFDIKITKLVQLCGIEAPDISSASRELAVVARNKLKKLVLNKKVIIKTYKTLEYDNKIYSGDIYVNPEKAGLICVNDWMIEHDLALQTQ